MIHITSTDMHTDTLQCKTWSRHSQFAVYDCKHVHMTVVTFCLQSEVAGAGLFPECQRTLDPVAWQLR